MDYEDLDQTMASTQADQCLGCPPIESLDTVECINPEQWSWWDCVGDFISGWARTELVLRTPRKNLENNA